MKRREPAENTLEIRQANLRSVLGMVGGRLALKLRRCDLMPPGTILLRPCCCEGSDPESEDLHAP